MALTLSKTGITTGQTIQVSHVTQSIDALTGIVAYDIKISGSLNLTGSVASFNGFVGNLTGTSSWATNAVSANTSSWALNSISSSFASTASFVRTAQTASYVATSPTLTGASYPSGSPSVPTAALKMVVGSATTGNPLPECAINITQIAGKTLGQDCFVTATVTGSAGNGIVVKSLIASTLTFESQAPNTDFHYHIVYI